MLRVLVVTNMYPSHQSQKGVFVKESVDELRNDPRVETVDVFNLDDSIWPSPLKYISTIPKLLRVLIVSRCTILHVHFGLSFIPVIALLPIMKFRGVRLIATFHGSDLMAGSLVNFISNLCAFFASKVILVSRHMSDYVWKSALQKCVAVPCGVDGSLFLYVGRDSWDESRPLTIIFPSDPSRIEKNYAMFDSIVNSLARKGINVSVRLFKGLDRKEVADCYSESNLMILASLREGSPQVIKEALLTGLPIATTRVGDVDEVLDGANNVYFFEKPELVVDWVLREFKGGSIDKAVVESKKQKYSLAAINNVLVGEYQALLNSCPEQEGRPSC